MPTYSRKLLTMLDKRTFLWYIISMKDDKSNLPVIRRIQDLNNEANKLFRDEVMMPMVKFAVTLMFIVIVLDYGFQMIEAIDILTQ